MPHLSSAHVTLSLHSELLPTFLVIGTHFVLHYNYVLYNPISFKIKSCLHVDVLNEPGLLIKGTWMDLVLSLSIGHMTFYLVLPILSLPRVIVLFCSGPLFEI